MEELALGALLVNTTCAALNLFFYTTQKSKVNLALFFVNVVLVFIILLSGRN